MISINTSSAKVGPHFGPECSTASHTLSIALRGSTSAYFRGASVPLASQQLGNEGFVPARLALMPACVKVHVHFLMFLQD